MQTSANGLQVMKFFESCRLKAYPDPKTGGAPWTCGWGTTGPDVGPATVWTQAQADTRFAGSLAQTYEPLVNHAVKVTVTQGQYDALVSIVYNVGPGSSGKDGIIRLRSGQPSSLMRMLNAGDYAGARAQFAAWVSPGTNVEDGLRRRRASEQALWDGATGDAAIAAADKVV